MIVLTTSTDSQNIRIIPRDYPSNVIIRLRDDSTNVTTNANSPATTDKDYLLISYSFSLKEGRFYDLTILDGNSVIYKDKIFCTDQDIDQLENNYYSNNKDVYSLYNGYDNQYTVR